MATDDTAQQDGEIARRLRAHLLAVPYLVALGAEVAEARRGFCALRLAVRPDFLQEFGHVHGGLVATLADAAAGGAVHTVLPAERGAVTVEFKLNYLAPAVAPLLLARAEVLRNGRTLIVIRGTVHGVTERSETLCASGLFTYLSRAPSRNG
jgi:uncharacterized protein (TIGR00369 family)